MGTWAFLGILVFLGLVLNVMSRLFGSSSTGGGFDGGTSVSAISNEEETQLALPYEDDFMFDNDHGSLQHHGND